MTQNIDMLTTWLNEFPILNSRFFTNEINQARFDTQKMVKIRETMTWRAAAQKWKKKYAQQKGTHEVP